MAPTFLPTHMAIQPELNFYKKKDLPRTGGGSELAKPGLSSGLGDLGELVILLTGEAWEHSMRFKPTEITTIIVATIAFAGSLISALYTYTNRNRELDIKFVEIGVGILRSDPNGAQANARDWAIKIVEKYSGQRFSEKEKRRLLDEKLNVEDYGPGRFIPAYTPDELKK